MKHILSIFLIALVISGTMQPPVGNCNRDEVWRCYQGACMTTAMMCPQIWEDGKYIGDCNTTSCKWDCMCLPKTNTPTIVEEE